MLITYVKTDIHFSRILAKFENAASWTQFLTVFVETQFVQKLNV